MDATSLQRRARPVPGMSARRRQRAEEAEATPLAPEADDTLPAAAPPETSDAQRLSPAAAEHLFPERRPPTAFERLFAAVNGAVRPQPPKARHEIASSTLLQQLVCANSVLSALWAAGWICLFLWKASVWEPPLHVVILSPTLYIAWAVFEPIRLTLGCLGNLHERIELLGPFMFSTLAVVLSSHLCAASLRALSPRGRPR